jgi:hypothetical protein
VAPTLIVIVDELPALTDVGLNVTEICDGWLAERLMFCAAPIVTAVPMVEVPLEPCPMLRLDGLAEMEKSLPVTVNVRLAE